MVAIESSVACIIARELAEGFFFTTSHIGMVLKTEALPSTEKRSYIIGLVTAIIGGLTIGAVISLAVGFSLQKALGDHLDDVSNGVEAGEAASKLVAFWFVYSLALKIPKWFGISNFVKESERPTQSRTEVDLSAVEKPSDKFESVQALSMSLFWNILRESTEGGVLTSLTIVLAAGGMDSWPESVGVGIASAVILGGGLAIGAKYVSRHGFGIVATAIIQMLAVGLITGATRSFEEVYEAQNEDQSTPLIYDYGDTPRGDALTSLEFLGISDNLTVLQIIVWIGSIVFLTFLQIWHHYLGYHIIPAPLRAFCATVKSLGNARRESISTNSVEKEKDIEAAAMPGESTAVDMQSNSSVEV